MTWFNAWFFGLRTNSHELKLEETKKFYFKGQVFKPLVKNFYIEVFTPLWSIEIHWLLHQNFVYTLLVLPNVLLINLEDEIQVFQIEIEF